MKGWHGLIVGVLASLMYAGDVKELSVFVGNDLSKNDPSVLTPVEREVVGQKLVIEQLKRDIQDVTAVNNELKSSLEGLRSLYESAIAKNSELSGRVVDLEHKVIAISENNESRDAVVAIQTKMDENVRLQNENFEKIGKTINDLVTSLDQIKQGYVSKEELNTTLASSSKEVSNPTKSSTLKEEKNSSESRFSQGVALFEKGQWIKAQKIFELLKTEKYNLEGSYFYLGEIAFMSNDYRNANVMYQKSLDLNPNSQYVPKILLHAGQVSMKTGDQVGAKKVFQTLVDVYPDAIEAKEATKLLKK